ncbi:MAG TPA: hypothetical protein VJB88_13015, partial [Vicinamibacteria bacterium]|nr:hypothetical protein [Vicinamibacteria bacterium]
MALKVDPVRIVQDPAYAAGLTDAHWKALAEDPVWNEMVGEFREMVEPVLALYAQRMGEAAPREGSPSTAGSAAAQAPFQVVGKRVPRLHGLGVVTDLGQYTENMRMPGMLFTRTRRSPHPHARVTKVDV